MVLHIGQNFSANLTRGEAATLQVILSGFSTPIANMPEAVQWLTYIDPLRYFLVYSAYS